MKWFQDAAELISVQVDKKTFKFPSIWLRDNCQCPSCYQQESHSRTIDWENFDFGAKHVSVESHEDQLMIEWSDGHRSTFRLQWLIDRAFTEENRKLFRETIYRFERVTWGAEQFQQCLKKFDYKTVLNESVSLFHVCDFEKFPWIPISVFQRLCAARLARSFDQIRRRYSQRCASGEQQL